jgi:hypothetical protein
MIKTHTKGDYKMVNFTKDEVIHNTVKAILINIEKEIDELTVLTGKSGSEVAGELPTPKGIGFSIQ